MAFSTENCSYVAYIDESGEAGTAFDRGSSEFIVMGAVIVPNWLPDLSAHFFGHAHSIEGKRKGAFPKFQKADEKARHLLTGLFRFHPIRTIHVALHKPTICEEHIGKNPADQYSYLIKLAVERISWFVRDEHHDFDPGNGQCRLVFSNNRALPYIAIAEYLHRLRHGRGRFNCWVDWRYISDEPIEVADHQDESPLHLADIASGALFTALDHSKRKLAIVDDRYIRILRDSICRNKAGVYGVKVFPRAALTLLREQRRIDFLTLL